MILLEFHNRIVEETLTRALITASDKLEMLDITCADFDGAMFRISTPEDKTKILVSLKWSCYGELQAHGAGAILEREYGTLLTSAESGYDVSLLIDTASLTAAPEEIVRKVSLLKRNVFAAPFEKCFSAQKAGQLITEPIVIHYRPDSSLWLLAQEDRVTAVYSTTFQDKDDIVIANKVFLQEFVDARKKVQSAPQVIYSWKEPPRELEGTDAQTGDNISYITFVLFPRHYEGAKADPCIDLLQTFRDYFHYHIKCSKAYLHSRMRARVASSLKILNRARPEVKVEKKTFGGKTFVRN